MNGPDHDRTGSTRQAADRPGVLDLAIAVAFLLTWLALALWRSHGTDVSGDEMWTRTMMRLPLADSWPFIVRDGKHPPLYLGLQMLLAPLLPDTAMGMRAVGMLAGAALPAAAYLLARRLGVSRVTAVVTTLWLGSNVAIRLRTVEARSYVVFALLVVVYAGTTALALRERSHRHEWMAATAAVLATLVHAFAILFFGAAGIAMLAIAATSTRAGAVRDALRTLLRIHRPAVVAFAAWYAFIAYATRTADGGIATGLEWMPPITAELRINTVAEVLGLAPVVDGTRLVLGLWLLLSVAFVVAARGAPRALRAGVVTAIAVFLPLVAQSLVSGVVADLPIFGTKHVLGTTGLLALAVAGSAQLRGLAPWWPRLATAALALAAAVALATTPLTGSRVISTAVARLGQERGPVAVRTIYEYGDLNVLNFYLDPGCLDDTQLRVQFPEVKGVPDFAHRSPRCRAQPASAPVPDSVAVLLLTWRPWVPVEVARKAVLESAPWRLQWSVRGNDAKDPHLDALVRARPPQPADTAR